MKTSDLGVPRGLPNPGHLPVAPGTLTEVFFRNGSSRISPCPEGWRWTIWGAPSDIITYRASRAASSPSEAALLPSK